MAPNKLTVLKPVQNIGGKVSQNLITSPIYDPTIPSTVPAASGGGSGDPWWMDALNTLGASSRLVTQQIDDWTDGKSDFKDIPGAVNILYNYGYRPNQKMFDDIFSGNISKDTFRNINWNNAAWAGKNLASSSDLLEKAGVTNPYVKGIGGFIGDVALDPTTYLTFGGSSAIKAGTKGMQKAAKAAIKDINKDLGAEFAVKAGRTAYKDLPQQVGEAYYRKAITQTGRDDVAELARNMAEKSTFQKIQNAGKSSRYNAQNALVNIDVPFTNVTYQFGKKPAKLTVSSPKIKQAGANALTRSLNRAGLVGDNAVQFVSKAVGKSSLEDVTLQEYRYLQDEIKKYAKFATENAPKIAFNGTNVQAFNQLDNFQPSQFVPDMGGRSEVGQALADRVRMFNPRNAGTSASGGLVGYYGDAIQDTFNRVRNNHRHFDEEARAIDAIERQGFTEKELRAIEYIREGKVPKGFDFSDVDMQKVQAATNKLGSGYVRMANAEVSAGALDKTMPNYAAHVINRSPEQISEIIQRYADDPELQRLANVAGTSGFNQERRSFKTFADMDNYLAGVSHELSNATDPAEISRLTQKLQDVETLFERNPFTAYKKRLYKSYKVRELSKLYRQMEEDSLLLTPDAAKELGGIPSGYVRLDTREASKLNVPAGSVMHKEVKDALLKVDALFTDQGLNKFLETATSITNIWKSLATSFRPVHHVNNLIGNVLNNSMAGVGVADYKKATASLLRIARKKPKQEDLNLIADAIEHGIFGQVHSDEYRRLFGNQTASKLRKAENLVTDNKYVNIMRKWLGDSTDNWTRLAHFVAIKDKTGSSELAAKSVRKYLFNYGEQTTADRAMRLLMPFWTWTKNNVPLQIEHLLKQPRYAQTYLRLQDTSYEMHGDSLEDQADFIREGYFETPWGTLRNPRAPVSDLNNVGRPLQYIGESLNPLVRVPFFEIPANKQLFTGKPIDRQLEYTGERDPAAWAQYGLSQAAFANDLVKLGSGTINPLDFLFGRELDMRRE